MDATQERALYNSWWLLFSNQWKHNAFSSAFLFQKFLMVFFYFEMLCNQKQVNIIHHVFYLVTPDEIKS